MFSDIVKKTKNYELRKKLCFQIQFFYVQVLQFTFNGQDMFEIFFTHADRQMWESSMPWPITEVKIKIVYYIQFLLSKKFCDIYFAVSNENEIW